MRLEESCLGFGASFARTVFGEAEDGSVVTAAVFSAASCFGAVCTCPGTFRGRRRIFVTIPPASKDRARIPVVSQYFSARTTSVSVQKKKSAIEERLTLTSRQPAARSR